MKQKNYKKLYDNKIGEYNDIRDINTPLYKQYIDVVINWKIKNLYKVLPKTIEFKSVLEIGTATGDLLKHFPVNTPLSQRTGLDISTKNVLEARKRYPEINFYDISFEDYLKDNIKLYDLIILSDILEHVPNDLEILNRAGKTAKYVLLNLPLEKCYEFRERNYGYNDFRGHLRAYNFEDAKKLVHDAGLYEINYIKKYYVKSNVFRRYLWNKLNAKENYHRFEIIMKYITELIEIQFHYTRYKSNFFALLKQK